MATAPAQRVKDYLDLSDRRCIGCGCPLTRSPHTSNREWRNKKFCRPGCRVQSGGSIAAVETLHNPERDSLISSSDMLRDSIMSVFKRIAEERGLLSEWEACAVVMYGAGNLK